MYARLLKASERQSFFELKMASVVRSDDLRGLKLFREDYPNSRLFFVHTGTRRWHDCGVEILPAVEAFSPLAELL